MPQEFDPYREWLKIPPSEQPPHHYRLLGLNAFESDPQMIEEGIKRLVGQLQSLSHGPHVKQAQELLNQVARIRLCLKDPEKKAQYDSELRTAMARRSNPVPESTLSSRHQALHGRKSQSSTGASSAKSPRSSRQPESPALPTGDPASVLWKGWQNWGLARQLAAGLLMTFLGGAIGFLIVQYGFLPRENSDRRVSQARSNPIDSPAFSSQTTAPLAVPARKEQSAKADTNSQMATDIDPVPGDPAVRESGTSIDQFAQAVLQEIDQPVSQPTPATNQPVANYESSPLPPGVYKPEHPSRFQDLLGTVIQLEGEAIRVTSSNSGKTHYILFSQNRNALLPVYASSNDLELENLSQFVGRRIRVRGPIGKRGTDIGLEVNTLAQIEIID
jgi:curved DNA-binding protein CbpA